MNVLTCEQLHLLGAAVREAAEGRSGVSFDLAEGHSMSAALRLIQQQQAWIGTETQKQAEKSALKEWREGHGISPPQEPGALRRVEVFRLEAGQDRTAVRVPMYEGELLAFCPITVGCGSVFESAVAAVVVGVDGVLATPQATHVRLL